MLALSQIQPATHMYRFTCSHQGAARLTQSCFSSIWPLCSSSGAAGGLFPVQGHLSMREESVSHLLSQPRFSQTYCAVKPGDLLVMSLLLILFFILPKILLLYLMLCLDILGGISTQFIAFEPDLLLNKLSFSDSLCTEYRNPALTVPSRCSPTNYFCL